MRVEIWSDVMCPFCYIGKRRFEKALRQFEHEDEVAIEWKSFQLNPDMVTDPEADINEYLSEAKGWGLDKAREMHERVTEMAEDEGLEYHMEKAVVANSFDAHRLIQYAKTKGKGEEIEEALFRAYFTEGRNIADHDMLAEIAESAGLDPEDVRQQLKSEGFKQEVKQDINEAHQLGLQGVPFYVFDRTWAVVGAQSPERFLDTLEKAWNESENEVNSRDTS